MQIVISLIVLIGFIVINDNMKETNKQLAEINANLYKIAIQVDNQNGR